MRRAIVIVAAVVGCGSAPVYAPAAPVPELQPAVERSSSVSFAENDRAAASARADRERAAMLAEQQRMNVLQTPQGMAAAIEAGRRERAEKEAAATIAKCAPTHAARLEAQNTWAAYDAGRQEASAWTEAHCRVRDTRRLVVTTTRAGAGTTESSVRNAGSVDLVCTAVMPKKLQAKQDAPAPAGILNEPPGCDAYDRAVAEDQTQKP